MSSNKLVVAKYSKNGDEFEIFINADLAYEFITGKRSDPLSVLEAEEVFKDARKGERQKEDKIMKVFGTTDIAKVAEIILKNGDVPITTEQRNKLTEDKRKQIVAIISKNSIDPRTNAPNPPMRIENAMAQAKVSIDPFKNANEQVNTVVSKISALVPIKFTTVKITVIIPPEYTNRCYGVLKQFGGIRHEEWMPDGSLKASVEFPAGMQTEFFEKINNATQGKAIANIDK
ncbi:MAG: ribosome assembly factor SBDS [Candidatus Micrarchaeota archaeon]|nr:ribosome assembly factor SBDS [Candidatus Micrarchaeota archaeon]